MSSPPPPLWNQLLYEAVMECLGYGKNDRPSLLLARSLRLPLLESVGLDDTPAMEAILLGAAGLIPKDKDMADRRARLYARALRKIWKAVRPTLRVQLLHQGDWLFFRLRPSNFPTARLAFMAALLPSLFGTGGFPRLVEVFKQEGISERKRWEMLARFYRTAARQFWRSHFSFAEGGRERSARLGRDRLHGIFINGLIPLLLLHGKVTHDRHFTLRVLRLYASLPALERNTVVTRLKRDVMRCSPPLQTARQAQALMQLDFAYCSRRKCDDCPLAGG